MSQFSGRQTQIIWDVVNSVFYDPITGELTSATPYISQGEQVLAQIQFIQGVDVNNDYIPYPLSGVMAFKANVNDKFGEQVLLAIQEDTSVINLSGDWVNGGTANPYTGQVSVRLDGTQSGVIYKLGTKPFINSKLEVQGTIANGNKVFIQRMPFYLYNNQDDTPYGINPVPSGVGYLTASETFALFWPRGFQDQQEELGQDGFVYVWGGAVPEGGDGLWHRRRRMWIDGILSEELDQNGISNVP